MSLKYDLSRINYTKLNKIETFDRVLMCPRENTIKTEAKGLYTKAKVCRGKHWQWEDQDGKYYSLMPSVYVYIYIYIYIFFFVVFFFFFLGGGNFIQRKISNANINIFNK